MSQNSLLASQFTGTKFNQSASKSRSSMVSLYSNDTLLRMSGFNSGQTNNKVKTEKPCCQTKGKSNVLLNNMGGSPIKLEADNKPCCGKGQEHSHQAENSAKPQSSKSCSGGSCGCGGSCGKEENKTPKSNSFENEINLDNQNFGIKEFTKSLENFTPDYLKLLAKNDSKFKQTVGEKITYNNSKNNFQFFAGNKYSGSEYQYIEQKESFLEIENKKKLKLNTKKLTNGDIISTIKSLDGKQTLVKFEYLKTNNGYQPNLGLQVFQKPIPLSTPLDLFNIISFVSFMSISVIDGKNNTEVKKSSTNLNEDKEWNNKDDKTNKTQSLKDGCDNKSCDPDDSGTFQISHGLYCNLPQLFNETIVTSDGRMYLTSICEGRLEFNIAECCKQHDIDLWCASQRSLFDVNLSSKIDDVLFNIVELLNSATNDVLNILLIISEISAKTARGADYKVVLCALNQAIEAIKGLNWWKCWVIGALLDTNYLILQAVWGFIGAIYATKEFHLFHAPCLLGLGGRNKDSCLCGGDKKTECCDKVAGLNTESIENCLIEAEYVDGKAPIGTTTIDGPDGYEIQEKYLDGDGKIKFRPKLFYKKNLCKDAPGIPKCRENCPSNCILDELGNRSSDIMPIEDPMGLRRPCCNKKDNWCDPNQKGSCRKCKYTCVYDSNNGKYLRTEIIENEYSKQYKCCEGTPKDIKCYPKNPNWDENWREKRNPNYGTTKQRDNYIIKNFVFEEIKVGG